MADVLGPVWAGATALAAPALRLYLRRRAVKGKEIAARLPERWGIDPYPRPNGRLIWLHAASVGETMSILPVLPVLTGHDPELTVLVTTGTVTSAELLASRVESLGLTNRVLHRFVPLDVPGWVRRFLDHWRPDAVGFVESELWPNILATCRTRRIPLMLINGRISSRSAATWSRFPAAARSILLGFTRVHARGEEDAARLRALGAARIDLTGDLKLACPELPADPAELRALLDRLSGRPVWTAASTHPGEEEIIHAVHQKLCLAHPGLLTIIVPRHPDRGPALAQRLKAQRRGLNQAPPNEGVWIADTLGQLGLWYRLSPVCFVGRSLIPPGGGQNPLEPARLGLAIAVGPHTDNFREHIDLLRSANALTVVEDVASLAHFVGGALSDPDQTAAMGARAKTAAVAWAALPAEIAGMLLRMMSED